MNPQELLSQQGLQSQQDPLAQLRDIILPGEVSLWPPAPGWWLLLLIVIVGLGFLGLWLYRRVQGNAYRREALKELQTLWEAYNSDQCTSSYLQLVIILLKRTALSAYPDLPVAGTHGRPWLTLLDLGLSNSTDFREGIGQVLVSAPYQANPSVDIPRLQQLVERWIKHHKPTLEPTTETGFPEGNASPASASTASSSHTSNTSEVNA